MNKARCVRSRGENENFFSFCQLTRCHLTRSYTSTILMEDYPQYMPEESAVTGIFETLRRKIIQYWHESNTTHHSSVMSLMPEQIIWLLSMYIPPFDHELFLYDMLQINPDRLTFKFQAPSLWKSSMIGRIAQNKMNLSVLKYAENGRISDFWNRYINVHDHTLEAKVISEVIISGEYPFTDLDADYIRFELDLSHIPNAWTMEESRRFLANIVTQTGAVNPKSSLCNLHLAFSDFGDDVMGLLCLCIQWRIDKGLPLTFELLNFAGNGLRHHSFELFCEFLPFMTNLHTLSFAANSLTDDSLECLQIAIEKMIDNVSSAESKSDCVYAIQTIDLSANKEFTSSGLSAMRTSLSARREAAPFMSQMTVSMEDRF